MADYFEFDRETFETELKRIAELKGLKVRDITEHNPRLREERIYDITTKSPKINIIIYSSLCPITGKAREVGSDALRVNLWCLNSKREAKFKKYKKHYRIDTIFKNLENTIEEINEWVTGNDARKWLYAVIKNS